MEIGCEGRTEFEGVVEQEIGVGCEDKVENERRVVFVVEVVSG